MAGPSQVALIFDRRITTRTPATFRTKVITKGVDPQLVCYYKASRIKQYFKQHRALRTETVIGDTRDFGIGRRVTSDTWRALRAVGEQANRRLCDAQAVDARPAPDVVTLQQVTRPSVTPDGLHAPACALATPGSWRCWRPCSGFATWSPASPTSSWSSWPPRCWTPPTAPARPTYDLRRLTRKGLIQRLPGSQRYLLTPLGRRVAVRLPTDKHKGRGRSDAVTAASWTPSRFGSETTWCYVSALMRPMSLQGRLARQRCSASS